MLLPQSRKSVQQCEVHVSGAAKQGRWQLSFRGRNLKEDSELLPAVCMIVHFTKASTAGKVAGELDAGRCAALGTAATLCRPLEHAMEVVFQAELISGSKVLSPGIC